MPEDAKLMRELDRCGEKILRLRVLSHAAAQIAEEMGAEIYALCIRQGRDDLRNAMDDITTAVFWLRDEIFGFQLLREEGSAGDTPK